MPLPVGNVVLLPADIVEAFLAEHLNDVYAVRGPPKPNSPPENVFRTDQRSNETTLEKKPAVIN